MQKIVILTKRVGITIETIKKRDLDSITKEEIMKRKSILKAVITFAMALQLMVQMSITAFAETTDNIAAQIDEFVKEHNNSRHVRFCF